MRTRDLPFIYITGGCRSGKSIYAQRLAEGLSSGCLYLATAAPPNDADDALRERIRLHREARGQNWRTYEAPVGDNDALLAALPDICRPGETLLFDCLTLWAAGHMRNEQAPSDFSARCDELLRGLWELACPVIIVSNEVGMGVVPMSAAGRNFRDMAGLAGQKTAAAATFAVLMVSGLPLVLKGTLPKICSEPEYCL
jgi:adenosylcobinamide kinase/adenosylcobinamide-phosphate guanylyltransferase